MTQALLSTPNCYRALLFEKGVVLIIHELVVFGIVNAKNILEFLPYRSEIMKIKPLPACLLLFLLLFPLQ